MTAKKHPVVVLPIKRHLRHSENYVPQKGEVNDVDSKTVPDMSMSLKDMTANFLELSQWQSSKEKQALYSEDFIIPDLKKLDYAEIQQMRMDLNDKIHDNKTLLEELAREQYRLENAKPAQQATVPVPVGTDS